MPKKQHSVGEVLELDRDCELGKQGERAVVIEIIEGKYMALCFPNRPTADVRIVRTGMDYRYVKDVA